MTCDNIKSCKNPGLTLSLEDTFLEKLLRVGCLYLRTKDKFGGGGGGGGLYSGGKHFHLKSVKFTKFLSFFQML